MTKEEKIKEAWSNYYTGEVDENGWLKINSEVNTSDDLFDRLEIDSKSYLMRPKSLQGIENNNGWVKIESENDLPKEKELFRFIPCNQFDNEFIGWIDFEKKEVFFIDFKHYKVLKDGNKYGSETNAWLINQITHYQPIIKPQPPIY